jgi:hypothetical protein
MGRECVNVRTCFCTATLEVDGTRNSTGGEDGSALVRGWEDEGMDMCMHEREWVLHNKPSRSHS